MFTYACNANNKLHLTILFRQIIYEHQEVIHTQQTASSIKRADVPECLFARFNTDIKKIWMDTKGMFHLDAC